MRSLDLSHNALHQLNDADLRPAKSLHELNLSYNKLRSLPSFPLRYLKRLDVSHNLITDITQKNFDGKATPQ